MWWVATRSRYHDAGVATEKRARGQVHGIQSLCQQGTANRRIRLHDPGVLGGSLRRLRYRLPLRFGLVLAGIRTRAGDVILRH